MALVEPEGDNRLLQDVLATPGNETCADCGNPGKQSLRSPPRGAEAGSHAHVAKLLMLLLLRARGGERSQLVPGNPPSLSEISPDVTGHIDLKTPHMQV